jgi:hypothetical protein
MKVVKQTAEYTVFKKRNNRYGVKGSNNQWINSDEKVTILLAEGLITVSKAAAPAEPEEAADESTEAAAEEGSEAAQESTETAEKDGE